MSKQHLEMYDYELLDHLVTHRSSSAGDSSGGMRISEHRFKPSFGEGRILIIGLAQGLELTVEDVFCPKDLVVHNTSGGFGEECVGSFLFSGGHGNRIHSGTSRLEFGSEVNWHCIPGEGYTAWTAGNTRVYGCHLAFSPRLLEELFPEVPGKTDPLSRMLARVERGVLDTSMVSYPLKPLVDSLFHATPRTPWEWIALESRILNLAGLFIEDSLAGPPSSPELSREEAAKLHRARCLLEENLVAPPSLGALAKRIGLNEFKLKKGFKLLFRTTVFGYLQERRLDTAASLLKSGEANVGEAAGAVGYTNSGAFAVAFKQRFGVSPGDVRRRRR